MSDDWNTYRTRFLVRAKQLTDPLTFTDALGREHHGRPGDYLVHSSNGLLHVAPKEIFEDVYVILEQSNLERPNVILEQNRARESCRSSFSASNIPTPRATNNLRI
jgi:hypothetical protein